MLRGCLPRLSPPDQTYLYIPWGTLRSVRWGASLDDLLFEMIWAILNHLIFSIFSWDFPAFWSLQPKKRCFEGWCSRCEAPECHKNPMKGTLRKAGHPAATSGYQRIWTDLRASLQYHRLKVASTSRRRSVGLSSELQKTGFACFWTWVFWERYAFLFQIFQWGSDRRRGSWSRWRSQRWSLLSRGHCLFFGQEKSCADNRMTSEHHHSKYPYVSMWFHTQILMSQDATAFGSYRVGASVARRPHHLRMPMLNCLNAHVPHEAWEHATPQEPRGAEAPGDGRQMM